MIFNPDFCQMAGMAEGGRLLLASNPGLAFLLNDIMLRLTGARERCEITPILCILHDRGQVKRCERFNGRRVVNVWAWVARAEHPMAA